MKHLKSLIALAFGQLALSSSSTSADDAHGIHLILLSGQSNMANMDPVRVFSPEVEKHFG
jgi:hypothetical protein